MGTKQVERLAKEYEVRPQVEQDFRTHATKAAEGIAGGSAWVEERKLIASAIYYLMVYAYALGREEA